MSGEHVELDGFIIECQKGKFKVKTQTGNIIVAQISGKLRKNRIRILLGDSVVVKVSPYDLTNGIITVRK